MAQILVWVAPLLLIVPNIALDITEISYDLPARAINVLLPAGVYLMLMSLWRRPGRMVVFLLPEMVLAAFQIVLLFLYGESIIAVDMFLNVVTTNVHEAGELLANLETAIVMVVVLYLPLLVFGILSWVKGGELSRRSRRKSLIAGAVSTLAGAIVLAVACVVDSYSPGRQLFPVNVVSNMIEAGHRTAMTKDYFLASEDFRFNTVCTDTTMTPTLVVLVIGETSRADNWQLGGYSRDTNPHLSHRADLTFFPRTLSESNTTHKSVPLMMSHLDASHFRDIYRSKGVIDAFGEAGYTTAWLSNQQRNGALIDFFGEQADTIHFLNDDGAHHFDMDLIEPLCRFIADNREGRTFAVLHTYGSHFNYRDRAPEDYRHFSPEDYVAASPSSRDRLLNAYDNTILYTDAVVDSVISTVEAAGIPAAVVYLADHGEDIFDDSRERFLHASPTPTYYQIHVPMLVWLSEGYKEQHPQAAAALEHNADRNVSSSRSTFHTLLDLGALSCEYFDPQASLISADYAEPERVYLNDYNEAVPLAASGLRDADLKLLLQKSISR